MNTQDFMNSVYDLIAQNEVSQQEKDEITEVVDHVDTERNAIVLRNAKGKEFELQLVDTYAPAPSFRRYKMSKDNLDFENKVQEIRNGVEYLQNAHDDEIIRLYKVIGDLRAEIKQLLEGSK